MEKIKLLTKLLYNIDKVLYITTKMYKYLEKISIYTIHDLIMYLPRHYNYKTINPIIMKHNQQIICKLKVKNIVSYSKNIKLSTYYNNHIPVEIWFFNSRYLRNKIKKNSNIYIDGTILIIKNKFSIIHPKLLNNLDSFNTNTSIIIEPIYKLTVGLTNKKITTLMKKIFDIEIYNNGDYNYCVHIIDFLDQLKRLHLPNENDNLKLILSNLSNYEIWSYGYIHKMNHTLFQKKDICFEKAHQYQQDILSALNFTLTKEQEHVLQEIERDQKTKIMSRLLQGDVGCGKTLIALLSCINVIIKNAQCAFMVPSEILAQQHYDFFSKALQNTPFTITLFTSKIQNKNQCIRLIADGDTNIIIGTHAIFQKKIKFKNLKYVIIDEQHRFGVIQRTALINKGHQVDSLIMTATPIPRTLYLTIFNKMDVSIMKKKVHSNNMIETLIMSINNVSELMIKLIQYIIKKQVVLWVCPLIGNSEKINLANANERYEKLKTKYGDKVSLLTSETNIPEKNIIMQKIHNKQIFILVATTIIEVGIDIPHATLIIIENAERFGLAQLHQLRGRIGRTGLPSHCILLYQSNNLNCATLERLNILKKNNDGFIIAEQDLKIRGHGSIFGLEQSGDYNFIFLNYEILNTKKYDILDFKQYTCCKDFLLHFFTNKICNNDQLPKTI